MTSKLLNAAVAAVLGFSLNASLYAADTPQTPQANRSAVGSDAEVNAMKECRKLTASDQAKCIVNVRRTATADKVGMTPTSPADGIAVKDGTSGTETEYAAAIKDCESANAADKNRCVSAAKERFGRM